MPKGRILAPLTPKHKAKISEALMGNQNSLGRKCTPETRAKIGLGNKGKVVTKETRGKISRANLGKRHTQAGKDKMSLAHKGKTLTLETRAKISASLVGRVKAPFTAEHKAKLSIVMMGHQINLGKHHTKETRAKISEALTGEVLSPETRAKMSKAQKIAQNTPESKDKRRKAMKHVWVILPVQRRNKWIKAMMAGSNIKPNKPETLILKLLKKHYPNEYKYVGDGQVIIGGCNPDFINVNGKKHIIECYGDYWHTDRVRCYKETEEGRIKLFSQYGYRTLIIWENELKDDKKLLEKIQSFEGGDAYKI